MKAIWDGKIPVINEAFAFQRVQNIQTSHPVPSKTRTDFVQRPAE